MSARVRAVTVAALVALAVAARTETVPQEPRPSGLAGSGGRAKDDAALEALAQDIFERLLALSPVAGPRPELRVSLDPVPKAIAEPGRVTVTRKLLRLCSEVKPTRGRRQEDTRDALIAFVLAHELQHLARGDPGSFGSREASEAVEKDADKHAVGRLVVARFDVQYLQLGHLLAAIARESPASTTRTTAGRVRGVRVALGDAKRRAREWNVAWLLTVSGRFDQSLAYYTSVASTYPYPAPIYALALTRLQAAWRVSPCSDSVLLEWLPPLRYDPRSQVTPFDVRSLDGGCSAFRRELSKAERELDQLREYPPALIALASVQLMQGPDKASIDATRTLGGVKLVGASCPEPASDDPPSRLETDACHVSLLAQYEMSGRSPGARQVAIDGLRRLRARWPSEPSLQFNLARLLTSAREDGEARTLWAGFLAAAGPGLHRKEAEVALFRAAADGAPQNPVHDQPVETPPTEAAPPADRLLLARRECGPGGKWPVLLSSVSYCGDWGDEIAVRNRTGRLIRSIAKGSRAWPNASPPATQPLFVTTNAAGEELRVWEEEAWVFAEKSPLRIVYFKKPQ